MSKTFTYFVKSKPEELCMKAKDRIQGKPIVLNGDAESGKAKGKGYEGHYRMKRTSKGTKIELTITRKPVLVLWPFIKAALDTEAKKW